MCRHLLHEVHHVVRIFLQLQTARGTVQLLQEGLEPLSEGWNLSPKVGTSPRRLEPLSGGSNLSPEVGTSPRRLEPLRGGWNLSAEVRTSPRRLDLSGEVGTSPRRLEPVCIYLYTCYMC
jgi:hypothetical protein